jgi:ABC-2 type transport system permease protein
MSRREASGGAFRRIGALVQLDIRELLKERGQLFTMIALPILLTLFFGLMLGSSDHESKVAVAVADLDGTSYSAQVVQLVTAEPSFSVAKQTEGQARKLVSDGKVGAAIVVPKGFGADVVKERTARLEVLKDPRSSSGLAVAQVVRGAAGRIAADAEAARLAAAAIEAVQRYGPVEFPPPTLQEPSLARDFASLYKTADTFWQPKPPVEVIATAVVASKVRGQSTQPTGFAQYSLGLTVMFMMFMALGTAGGVLEERELGTLPRLLTTPTRKSVLLGGKLSGILVTVGAQAAIMILVGVLVFRVPWLGDPLGVLIVLGSYALACTAIGVALTAAVRTRGQFAALTPIIATSLSMLGGCYWPLDIVPPLMQKVALATPTGWAMTGLVDVVVRNQGVVSALTPAAVLLGIAGVFFALGVRSLRFE